MADRMFVVPGQGDAPFEWPLSADLRIQPKIARASYDGSAATGSYRPCLRIISDSGHIAYEAVADTTVAAGASADVSWFRGLRAGASATPTPSSAVMPYALVSVGSYNWPVGSTFVNFGLFSVSTSDSSVFEDNTLTDPTTPILILKAGIYIAWAGIGPWDPAWGQNAVLATIGPDLGAWGGMGFTATNYPVVTAPFGGVVPAGPTLTTFTETIFTTDPVGGGQVRMEANQNSGATRNVSAAIRIIRLTGNGDGF